MCGLILAKGFSDGQILSAMSRMEYRGKDGKQGISHRGSWTMGHVRLAIQDLSDESSQPVEAMNFNLGFVGELFGLEEGQIELEEVVNTYRGKGPKGFHAYDGFWAVAVAYSDGTVRAFTDYLGQKPLYYWESKGIICSEMNPMFALCPCPKFDDVYLANVIKWGYDCTGRTPFLGITQIPPGTVLEISAKGESKLTTYWDWSEVPIKSTSLRSALTTATLNRLVGDREVGLLLSGGLDSYIVYSILKEAGKKVRCFSIENGESEYLPEGVKTMAALPGDWTINALISMQCPVDLGSMVPQYLLGMALKAEGLNVCLSGDGADELFGGYKRAAEYDSQASDIFMELPYYHLPRLDRLMMRSTVELRSPFLAPEVVYRALQIPYAERTEKQLLKETFKDLIPSNILERKKHPLKTDAVIGGGLQYRKHLVELFTC